MSSASAATFTPEGPMVQKGNLTLRLNGGSPVVCPVEFKGTTSLWESTFALSPVFDPNRSWKCANGGKFGLSYMTQEFAQDFISGAWVGSTEPGYSGWAPYTYKGQATAFEGTSGGEVTFTNASGGSPSTVTYSETLLGQVQGTGGVVLGYLTANGTLQVSDGSGGDVTIE